jgi:hypothetical protein
MKLSASRKTITAFFILLFLGIQTPASADGFYFGGGAYVSEAKVLTLDETDETLAFIIGYNLIDSNFFLFSFELGAYDLGEYSSDDVEVDADAISLAAVGSLPLGPFIELYGKIGAAEVSVEVNDEDFDGTEAFYGVGISFDILDTIDIYLEYLEFDTEVDLNSVGVGIKFDLF